MEARRRFTTKKIEEHEGAVSVGFGARVRQVRRRRVLPDLRAGVSQLRNFGDAGPGLIWCAALRHGSGQAVSGVLPVSQRRLRRLALRVGARCSSR